MIKLDEEAKKDLDKLIYDLYNKEFSLDVTGYEVVVVRNEMIKFFSRFAQPKVTVSVEDIERVILESAGVKFPIDGEVYIGYQQINNLAQAIFNRLNQ